jgi:hypothetical protein
MWKLVAIVTLVHFTLYQSLPLRLLVGTTSISISESESICPNFGENDSMKSNPFERISYYIDIQIHSFAWRNMDSPWMSEKTTIIDKDIM